MNRRIYYEGEKILKGASNHRRLEMLSLLNKTPGLSTDDMIKNLKINYQTGAVHIQKLVRAGLVVAYRQGRLVLHKISPLGLSIIRLCIK